MTKNYEKVRESIVETLTEALTQPYPYVRLPKRDPKSIHVVYNFTTSSKLKYQVEFAKHGNWPKVLDDPDQDSVFNIIFYIADKKHDFSLDKSGTGDSFRVFATVTKIIDEFIINVKPAGIKFSSDKSDGAGRENLYRRLAQQIARKHDGELKTVGSSYAENFYINFPRQVAEDLQDFRSFRNELKPLNDMSTTVHRDKAFNLATILATKYGYKPVGKGAKATVFEKPGSNEVLKFFLQDSAYARWVKFCLANQGNPYLPKLRGKIKVFQKPWYYIRMENLKPVYDDSANKLLAVIGAMQMELDEYPLEDHMERAKPPETYLWPIANIFNRNEKILDLHDGNFMKRSNGQLVIVDPFYNFYRTKDNQYTIDPEHE